MDKIQPGSKVTFDLKGNAMSGHVTLIEGNKATVLYIIDGLDLYALVELDSLSHLNTNS